MAAAAFTQFWPGELMLHRTLFCYVSFIETLRDEGL